MTMRKGIIRIICYLLFIVTLCGCGQKHDQGNNTSSLPIVDTPVTETTSIVTPESTSDSFGLFTLDDCKLLDGIFIAYDDGSFDRYPGRGYCYGLSNDSIGFYGMFIDNYEISKFSPITNETNMAIFSSSNNYSVTLHPIHASVATIKMTSDDGTIGYGLLTGHSETYTQISIHYENHDIERFNPIYIDGKPAVEYQAVKLYEEVTPYKGMSRKVEGFTNLGFQEGTTIALGVSEGTSLIETTYEVNSTYFDCHPDHNNWEEEDVYYATLMPTSSGYATVDLSHIPSGQYVLLYRADRTYRANIITWEND